MPIKFHSTSSQFSGSILLTASVILLLALVLPAKTRNNSPALPESHLSGTATNVDERMEAVLITLKRTGLEPSEIQLPVGRFILVVHNRSGLEEMNIEMVDERGAQVKGIRVHRKKLDWKEIVTLSPGTYILREINNPAWTCRLTIAPR